MRCTYIHTYIEEVGVEFDVGRAAVWPRVHLVPHPNQQPRPGETDAPHGTDEGADLLQ